MHTKIKIKMKAKSVKLWLLALLSSLSCFNTFAQDSIVVKGTFVGNTKYAKVLMKKFEAGSFVVSGATIKNEKFALTLPSNIPAGVYRFVHSVLEGEQFVDIIINGKEKEISYTLQANEAYALPVFNTSDENKLWYTYIQQNRAQLDRVSLLNQFINAYPNTVSKVYQEALKEWEVEKSLYYENLEKFTSQTKGSWAYEMVINRPFYFTNPKDHPLTQGYYKHLHFWDGFNASNPALINSPLYTDNILNYLRYWMNPNINFSEEEQTKGFKNAVDTIMQKFSGSEVTKEFAYKYLTLGFKEIGQEEVLQYLDEQYSTLAEQCLNETEKTEYEKRMEGYAALKAGNMAPEIIFPDTLIYPNANFHPKKLSEFTNNYTLVVLAPVGALLAPKNYLKLQHHTLNGKRKE